MSFARYVSQLDISPGRAYAPFWSAFTQALRSTMDQEAQRAHGQSTPSTIRVSTSLTSDGFALTVEGNSPGTDWHAVRNACEALGGFVEMESHPGDGTRIRFAFPKDDALHEAHTEHTRRTDGRATSAA